MSVNAVLAYGILFAEDGIMPDGSDGTLCQTKAITASIWGS
ncbi:hypothetical protein [Caballeronia grimmiae]